MAITRFPGIIAGAMRRTILLLHLCGALLAGLFLIVLGVTGAIMAFEEDLDRLMNPALYASHPEREPLGVSAILSALRSSHPTERISRLQLPQVRGGPFITQIANRQVFVDGATGSINGTRSGPTLLVRIHQFHISLMSGRPGSVILGVASILLVVLIGTGLYLWWPHKRSRVELRRVTGFDLHNAIGIWSSPLVAILGATGIIIAFSETVIPLVYALSGSSPPARDAPSTIQPGSQPITPEDAIRTAVATLPGAAPLALTCPSQPSSSYVVALRFPEDLTPGGRSWVVVDHYRGVPLVIEDSRHPPAGAGVATLNRAIHTGDIGGYAGKAAVSAASVALVVQVISGAWLWWQRRRRQAQAGRRQVAA